SEAWAVATAAVVMLIASYVLVGVGPRTVGRQHPYAVGLKVAGPVRAVARVFNPLTRLLILVGNLLTPGGGFREGPFSTEVELRELVDIAGESGVVAAGERKMIHSVFDLGDTLAREVMVPRTEIIWVERDEPARRALTLCLRTGFSRLPVIGQSVDDIVGVVNLKDLTRAAVEQPDQSASKPTAAELMRSVRFVPD